MQNEYRVNRARAAHETIDGEVVIIDIQTGSYYSLTPAASFLWGAMLEGATPEELRGLFTGSNGEDVAAAVDGFVSQLVADELVVEGPAPSSRPALPAPIAFAVPAVEKFTDMQDLLMLDPIHEVDAEGAWPHRKPTE